MSGLLSLERLWRGERWECFEDGLHFCSAFSRRIFFFFALRFVEPCLGGRSAFGLPREPEGPACSWHTSIPNPFGRGNKSSSTGRAAKCVIIFPSGCILQGLPVLAARSHPCTSGTAWTASRSGCSLETGQTGRASSQRTAPPVRGLSPLC